VRVEAAVPIAGPGLARQFYEGVLGLEPGESHRPDRDVTYQRRGGRRLNLSGTR
jgi:hypothetical protein